jgi:hypothetical protein
MILGGMIPLCEGVRLHFNSIQGMAMDRSSFLREAASSNNLFKSFALAHWDAPPRCGAAPLNNALGDTRPLKKMKASQVLRHLEQLLAKNEGVEVVGTSAVNDILMLEFTVADPNSRLLLVSAAGAANLFLDLWDHHEPGSPQAIENPETAIHYRYRSNKDYESVDNFCWLGTHLTWKMYKVGVISSTEEKHYCEVFGAISRSA